MSSMTPVKVAFRSFATSTNSTSNTGLSTTWDEIDLIPANLGSKCVAMSAIYEKFRVTSLHAILHLGSVPTATGSTAPATENSESAAGIGFNANPSAQTGAISSLADASQLAVFAFAAGVTKVRVGVSAKYLLATGQQGQPVDWFDTGATGTPPDEMRYQGTVYWKRYVNPSPSPTLATTWIELSGTIEFASPVASGDAITRKQRALLRAAASNMDGPDSKSEFENVESPRLGGLTTAPDWLRDAVRAHLEEVRQKTDSIPVSGRASVKTGLTKPPDR